jgi:hypothetical protein
MNIFALIYYHFIQKIGKVFQIFQQILYNQLTLCKKYKVFFYPIVTGTDFIGIMLFSCKSRYLSLPYPIKLINLINVEKIIDDLIILLQEKLLDNSLNQEIKNDVTDKLNNLKNWRCDKEFRLWLRKCDGLGISFEKLIEIKIEKEKITNNSDINLQLNDINLECDEKLEEGSLNESEQDEIVEKKEKKKDYSKVFIS